MRNYHDYFHGNEYFKLSSPRCVTVRNYFLDLGKLLRKDQRVALLYLSTSLGLVVERATVRFSVAVERTEYASAP